MIRVNHDFALPLLDLWHPLGFEVLGPFDGRHVNVSPCLLVPPIQSILA